MKTVAIIGSGFCGTMAAVNLARLAKQPLRLILINYGAPTGRGVAYGTRHREHLLNVAARNMSAFPDQPHHFLDWLGTRSEYAETAESVLREQFIPRQIYGDYLQSLLFWHARHPAHPNSCIEIVNGQALDLVPGPERVSVVIAGHATMEADMVVLATGNQAPTDLPGLTGDFSHPRFLSNPWQPVEYTKADRHENIVFIGAGLTMIDVFLTLSSLDWQGTMYAVSRTGLLPLSHFHGVAHPEFPPADPAALGLSVLANLVEEHCQRLRDRGENPAIIVDKLRPFVQRIWQNFTLEEKARFCRDYRTRWNVARHRIAESIHERLTAAIEAGKLQMIQGRFRGLSDSGDRLRVTIEGPPPNRERFTLEAGWVLNCTGPNESYSDSKEVLYQNLIDRGIVQADDMDMGIKVDANFAVIDGGGQTSCFLYAIGPMLKGSLWESTAVPELRIQALRVAETMLTVFEGEAGPGWFAEMWVDVIEYVI